MKTYRMLSSGMISAPGMVAWAQNFYKIPEDKPYVVKVIMAGWNLPENVVHDLLSGKIKFAVEGSMVIFDA